MEHRKIKTKEQNWLLRPRIYNLLIVNCLLRGERFWNEPFFFFINHFIFVSSYLPFFCYYFWYDSSGKYADLGHPTPKPPENPKKTIKKIKNDEKFLGYLGPKQIKVHQGWSTLHYSIRTNLICLKFLHNLLVKKFLVLTQKISRSLYLHKKLKLFCNIIKHQSITKVFVSYNVFLNSTSFCFSFSYAVFTLEPTILDSKLIWICVKMRSNIYPFPTVYTRL